MLKLAAIKAGNQPWLDDTRDAFPIKLAQGDVNDVLVSVILARDDHFPLTRQ